MASKKTFVGVFGLGGGAIPPVIALAQGLSRRGHRVVMVSDEEHRPQVEAVGLESIEVPAGHTLKDSAQRTAGWRGKFERGDSLDDVPNPYLVFAEDALPFVIEQVRSINPDALFSSLFTLGLTHRISEALGVPWSFVNPAFVFGRGSPRTIAEDFGGRYFEHSFPEWVIPIVDKAGLVIHTTDREYDLVTPELPGNHHQVGPLNVESEIQTPEYLLEDGPAWILVSVAVVGQPGEIEIVQSALQALAGRDLRVIATVPGRADEIIGIPANAKVVDFAPHSEVLKFSNLVISHAGHGLVMRALERGVPMVLVPWGRDQPGVAYRAEQLGVASVVTPEDLSVESMSAAISRVLESNAVRAKSKQVAERLASEDPLGMACDLIESLLK